jgi:hypothetical protein
MTTTPNMSLVLPDNHGSTDTWDVILETLFGVVDLHDHSTGKGVPIPSGALRINDDVSWSFAGTTYAITDLRAVDFTPATPASITGYSSALFVNSSDANNLYFRNASGANVRITNGSTIDVTVVGGIGGDYASISALLDYDDASDTYRFRQQTSAFVRQFAKVSCADVQLFEYFAAGVSPVPSNSVRLRSPAALAASYNVTWLAALPSVQGPLSIDNAGQLTVDKHGDRVLNLPATIGQTSISVAYGFGELVWNASGTVRFPIPLRQGDRIKSISCARYGDAAVDVTTWEVYRISNLNVPTTIGSTTLTNVPVAVADTTIDVTDTTLGSGDTIMMTITANAATFALVNIRVTYDRP